MEVICTNKECLHKWNYRGGLGDKDYITCSKCRYKSMLKKAKFSKKLSEKSTDLLTDLPTNSQYTKEIKQPQTEAVEKGHYDKKERLRNDVERVDIGDGITALVEKKIAKQIRDSPGEVVEEEIEVSLFDEPINKLCKDHNLPARYSSSDRKWVCEDCSNNLIDEELKVVHIEVEDVWAKDQKRIIPKKYKERTDHLGEVNEVTSQPQVIRVIPRDPIKIINHQKEYGSMIAN